MSIKSYYKEVMSEMKNVKWPSGKHTVNATIVVIVISILMGAYLFAVDIGFKDLLNFILNRK